MQTDAVFTLSHSNITHSISTGNMGFWKDNSVKFQIKQSVSYFDLSRSCFPEKLPSGIFLEGVTHLPKSCLYVNQNEGPGSDSHKQWSTAWFSILWEVQFKLVWGKSSCLRCCGTSSISRTCLLLKKILAAPHSMWDLSSPTRNWTPYLLKWKYRVLATGPLGKSLGPVF